MARERKDDRKRIPEYKVEGARIMFRNFAGKKTDYNEAGNRNFALCVPEEDVEKLMDYGWNVKRLKPREDNPLGQAYIPVKVKYGDYPPIAAIISSRGGTRLDESTIEQLDWVRIKNVDLTIRPYQYGPTAIKPDGGVSAYLKNIYVTIQEDALEEKYSNIDWSDAVAEMNDDPDEDEVPFK